MPCDCGEDWQTLQCTHRRGLSACGRGLKMRSVACHEIFRVML
jgi:hypothetical protein